MKTSLSRKLLGFVLIILSILGILFSISGIIATWVIRPRLRDSLSEAIASLEDALTSSQKGVTLLDQSISDLLGDFSTIEESFESLDITLSGITTSLETSADLIGDDLKQTVSDTQIALDSAVTTAELIDNTLKFLSRIPLLGVDYDPEVPLHISLEQVAENLDTFPATLEEIETGLKTTTDGLASLQTNLMDLNDLVQSFSTNLENAQVVLGRFNDSIGVMETRLESFNENLTLYLSILSLLFTGIFFWLGLSQISILSQGFLYFRGETTIVNLLD